MTFDVKRLAREPLIHFLALGTLLFVVYGLVNDDLPQSELGTTIEIGAQEVEFLRTNFVRQWNRPPTETELTGLVNNRVREEVLFREAMAMGLDANDIIIRRRMVQKLDFFAEDLMLQAEATEEELRAFLSENPERFEVPAILSFSQIYFSTDYRDDAAGDAGRLRDKMESQVTPARAAELLGDRFMLPFASERRSRREVARQFGTEFAEALFGLQPSDEWQGPISSSFGVHLVRISELEPSRAPEWSEVADRVRADYETARRDRANAEFYESLLARYEVTIDEAAIRGGSIQPAASRGGG